MAIAFDATINFDTSAASTDFSFNHTVGTSASPILLVGFSANEGADSTTSVTYNTVAMTKIGAQAGTSWIANLYILINPASGTHAVRVQGGNVRRLGACASYFFAKQTTQPEASTNLTNTSSLTLTTTKDKAWLVAYAFNVNGDFSSAVSGGLNSKLRQSYLGNVPSNHELFDSNDLLTPAGSYTLAMGTNAASGAVVASIAPVNVITVQPQNTSANIGSTAVFTVTAVASAGSLSYQWVSNGSNVGTNSNTYTTGTLSATDNLTPIYCQVTDSTDGTEESNHVYLLVNSSVSGIELKA